MWLALRRDGAALSNAEGPPVSCEFVPGLSRKHAADRPRKIELEADGFQPTAKDLRRRVEALGAVETATVQFDPQGTLRITVVGLLLTIASTESESEPLATEVVVQDCEELIDHATFD